MKCIDYGVWAKYHIPFGYSGSIAGGSRHIFMRPSELHPIKHFLSQLYPSVPPLGQYISGVDIYCFGLMYFNVDVYVDEIKVQSIISRKTYREKYKKGEDLKVLVMNFIVDDFRHASWDRSSTYNVRKVIQEDMARWQKT